MVGTCAASTSVSEVAAAQGGDVPEEKLYVNNLHIMTDLLNFNHKLMSKYNSTAFIALESDYYFIGSILYNGFLQLELAFFFVFVFLTIHEILMKPTT